VPRFSIVTPVYDPSLENFHAAVESVVNQDFTDWEWVVVEDSSPNAAVRAALRDLAQGEARVRLIEREENGGIVAASNDGIDGAAGEFLVFLDDDDLLTPDALSCVEEVLREDDEVDYVYSDEDKVYADGSFGETFRKPDWSPERLMHQMYTSHLSVVRTSLVREIGGLREGFDGSQDHDLVLRISEKARTVAHIPAVLYHWRVTEGSAAGDSNAKPYAWDAGLRAVAEHVTRLGIDATVVKGKVPGRYTLLRTPDRSTPTSIIIPTRGTQGRVRGTMRVYIVEMIRSIVATSRHDNLEFVVVYDSVTPSFVLDELRVIAGDRLVLVEFAEEFNFSRKCNVGYLHASGDVLLFMNDDMEAYSDGVVEQLIAPLKEDGVGMTGARLLFEDTRHQHAGLCYGDGSIAHGLYRYPMDARGYADALWMNREVSALTGACVAITRENFELVGGFSEALGLNFNDVDFSMKVRSLGLRLLWLENVTLFHFESVSRSTVVESFEIEIMKARWGNFEKMREKYALPPWGPPV
jgi:GT2 family glycosyltransferase